jgi:hypothetical protein
MSSRVVLHSCRAAVSDLAAVHQEVVKATLETAFPVREDGYMYCEGVRVQDIMQDTVGTWREAPGNTLSPRTSGPPPPAAESATSTPKPSPSPT